MDEFFVAARREGKGGENVSGLSGGKDGEKKKGGGGKRNRPLFRLGGKGGGNLALGEKLH